LLWSTRPDTRDVVQSETSLGVVTSDSVVVLNADTGDERFSIPRAEEASVRIALDARALYLVSFGEVIEAEARDVERGEVLWRARPVASEFEVNAVAVGREALFACAGSSLVLGWSKHDGRRVIVLGVPGCADFAVHAGPPEELSSSENGTTPLLFFRPEAQADPRVILEGTITDVLGRPLPGLRVDAGLTHTRTDARGHYRVVPGVPGEVCVFAHGADLESAVTCVRPRPGETRRLDLNAGRVAPDGPRLEKRRLP
jgi:hypothetical protein